MDRGPSLASLAAQAKESQPDYFGNPAVHQLLCLLLEQAEDLGVIWDRLETAKKLGGVSDQQIDEYMIEGPEAELRLVGHLAKQEKLLSKLLDIFNTD